MLRFTPASWAKLLFLRDYGCTEVGGFGVGPDDDLLLVREVCLVKQTCTAVTVSFDDESVADFFDAQVDRGRRVQQFGRLWLHTHPGDCPLPSSTDEATFDRVFGGADWAVMFILAKGGQSYARLRFNVGPGGSVEIPIEVDYRQPFEGSDHAAWEQEYLDNVTADDPFVGHEVCDGGFPEWPAEWLEDLDETADAEEDETAEMEAIVP